MLCSASLVSNSVICGCGGGASTFTCADDEAFKPRESVHVAVTVTVPGDAPVVFSVAVSPVPEIVPPVAVQLLTVTGTLSGLVHVQWTLTVPPACRLVGVAEQLIVGGFFGSSFTVKFAEQVVVLFFFSLGSVTLTVAV